MIIRLHVVREQFLCCVTISAPWRNASLFNMCICNGALYESSLVLWPTHVFSLSLFNDAHSAECSLLGVYGLFSRGDLPHKNKMAAAQLSGNYSGNLGNRSPRLVIVSLISFYVGSLTYVDACIVRL